VRLFVAVELPEPARLGVGRLVARARSRFPPASWVKPGNLHATLAFVGEAGAEEVAAASAGLLPACAAQAPIAAATAGTGAFPPRGPVRVVWIALEPAAGLAALAGVARGALASAGLRFDERPFQAHVTIARARSPWPPAWREELPPLAAESLEFALEEVVLLDSELAPGGSIYRRVAAFPLAARVA
jgi:2'-5' RNA ligase